MSTITLVKGLVDPDVPSAGQLRIYAKTDGELYTRNDNGTVQLLSGLSEVADDPHPVLANNLDADSNKIINLADPVAAQDVATKNYVDTEIVALMSGSHLSNVVEDTSPQLGGNLDVNGFRLTSSGNVVLNPNSNVDVMASRIINLGAPTASTDATTKTYVDGLFATAVISGIDDIVEDTTPQLGGNLDAQSFKINNLMNPASSQDAATMDYVDTEIVALSLGSAAQADITDFLQVVNDLSDLNSAPTARTNLGVTIGSDVQAWNTNLDSLSGLTLPADLSAGTNKITNLMNPAAAQDAATKDYVDTEIVALDLVSLADVNITPGPSINKLVVVWDDTSGKFIVEQRLTQLFDDTSPDLGGTLNAQNFGITNLADPSTAQDGATKNYVDTEILALNLWSTFTADSGSTSASTHTDTLNVSGGTGISTVIIGDTLTITNDLPDQNIWSTITDGSNNAVPDSSADTFTLTGAGGIIVTVDSSGDSATFDGSAFLQNIVEDVSPQLGNNLDVNGFIIGTGGDVVIVDTLVALNDNASSFRLRGPDFNSATVQSYAGIFYNADYAGTSSSGLETRVVFGANVEMDLEIQGPRQVRITAVDNSQSDGQVRLASRTDVAIHTRADAETDSPNHVIFDRETTGTTGGSNISNATVETDSGNLVLWPGRQGSDATAVVEAKTAVQLATHTVASAGSISSPVAGQVIYVSNGDTGSPCLAVYDGSSWKRIALGATIST